MADAATRAYERARKTVASFISSKPSQIAFTMNATDSLNQAIAIVAQERFGRGKNAVTTVMEHHSALLPLQRACRDTETELRFLPIREDGTLDLEALDEIIDEQTVCAVLTLGANSTGYALPWQNILPKLKEKNICIILDATQRIVHERLDVKLLDADFLCFSGHKLYGPMGIGVLYVNDKWNNRSLGRLGGGMVERVTANDFIRVSGARALEAGTPPIAEALGLESAIEYLTSLVYAAIREHERNLQRKLRYGLASIPDIHVLTEESGLPIVSFYSDVLHAVELNKLLSMRNFALRDGRHCAHIFHERMGVSATVRASLAIYNTENEIDALLNAVDDIQGKWRCIKR